MSIRSQITRLENAKADILDVISKTGVTIPKGVLLEDIPELLEQMLDYFLTVEIDGDPTAKYISIELDE